VLLPLLLLMFVYVVAAAVLQFPVMYLVNYFML
jgi:hypothetical protein